VPGGNSEGMGLARDSRDPHWSPDPWWIPLAPTADEEGEAAAMNVRRFGRLRRCVLLPFGGAMIGGLGMLALALIDDLTGFRGPKPQVAPIPLSEAWPEALMLAQLVFVVTLLVLLVWAWIRGKSARGE
jgi:hypothetical protein